MGGCEGFTGLRPLGGRKGGGWALDSRWELLKQGRSDLLMKLFNYRERDELNGYTEKGPVECDHWGQWGRVEAGL